MKYNLIHWLKKREREMNFIFGLFAFLPFVLSRLDYQTNHLNMINFFLTFVSFMYFFNLYRQKLSFEKIKKWYLGNEFTQFIFGALVIATVLEFFNMTSPKDFVAYFQIIFTFFSFSFSYYVLYHTDTNCIKKIFDFHLFAGVFFSLFSLIVMILPNNIQMFHDKYYLVTDFILGISLRQEIMGIGNNVRYSSLFSNPNGFGFYMYISLSLITYKMARELIDKRLKIKTLISLLALLIGLLMSGSRASILSYLLFLIFYLLFVMTNNELVLKIVKKYKFLILVVLSPLVAIVFLKLTQRGLSVDKGRLELWNLALESFRKNPITGIGTYQFRNYVRSFGFPHVHNSYFQLLGSGGFLYLSFYLIMVLFILKRNFPIYQDYTPKNNFIFSLTLSLLFYQLVENIVLVIHPYIIIFSLSLFYSLNLEKF